MAKKAKKVAEVAVETHNPSEDTILVRETTTTREFHVPVKSLMDHMKPLISDAFERRLAHLEEEDRAVNNRLIAYVTDDATPTTETPTPATPEPVASQS